MKRVLTAVVLIPLVLLVLFKAPLWLFTLAVGVVAMGAAWEYLKLVDAYNVKSFKTIPLMLGGFAFLSTALIQYSGIAPGRGLLDQFLFNMPAILLFSAPFIILALGMTQLELKNAVPAAGLSAIVIPYVIW